jgi:hypothetical protein
MAWSGTGLKDTSGEDIRNGIRDWECDVALKGLECGALACFGWEQDINSEFLRIMI